MRAEKDSIGFCEIQEEALYGISFGKARENFPFMSLSYLNGTGRGRGQARLLPHLPEYKSAADRNQR
jgi:hypothetical protein